MTCASSRTSSSGSAPSSTTPTTAAASASATTSSSPSGCARPATSRSRPRTRLTTSSTARAEGGGRTPWVPGVPSVVGGGGPAGAPARSRSATTSRGVSARSGIGSMRSLRTVPSTTSSTCPHRPGLPPPPPPPSPPGTIWRSTRLGWTSTARAAPGRLDPSPRACSWPSPARAALARRHSRGRCTRASRFLCVQFMRHSRISMVLICWILVQMRHRCSKNSPSSLLTLPNQIQRRCFSSPTAWAGASRDDEMQRVHILQQSSNNY